MNEKIRPNSSTFVTSSKMTRKKSKKKKTSFIINKYN